MSKTDAPVTIAFRLEQVLGAAVMTMGLQGADELESLIREVVRDELTRHQAEGTTQDADG